MSYQMEYGAISKHVILANLGSHKMRKSFIAQSLWDVSITIITQIFEIYDYDLIEVSQHYRNDYMAITHSHSDAETNSHTQIPSYNEKRILL